MKLSIIIPVYNEVNTIQELFKRVESVPLNKEIIIVDDFSTDGTRDVLKLIKNTRLR
jgi:glycosyltransferase involved in cell wall biosynthesis